MVKTSGSTWTLSVQPSRCRVITVPPAASGQPESVWVMMKWRSGGRILFAESLLVEEASRRPLPNPESRYRYVLSTDVSFTPLKKQKPSAWNDSILHARNPAEAVYSTLAMDVRMWQLLRGTYRYRIRSYHLVLLFVLYGALLIRCLVTSDI